MKKRTAGCVLAIALCASPASSKSVMETLEWSLTSFKQDQRGFMNGYIMGVAQAVVYENYFTSLNDDSKHAATPTVCFPQRLAISGDIVEQALSVGVQRLKKAPAIAEGLEEEKTPTGMLIFITVQDGLRTLFPCK